MYKFFGGVSMATESIVRIQSISTYQVKVYSSTSDARFISLIVVDAIQRIARHEFTTNSDTSDPYVELELNPNFRKSDPKPDIFQGISSNQDASHAIDILCNCLRGLIVGNVISISIGQ